MCVFILAGSRSCCFTLLLIERNQHTVFFPVFFFLCTSFHSVHNFSPSVYLVFSFAPPFSPPSPPPHTWLSILPHSISPSSSPSVPF